METLPNLSNAVLTVTGLNEKIRDLLEDRFAYVQVRGEVSDFHEPASGHLYFALVDGQSRIRAVIWRGTRRRLSLLPATGQTVLASGRIAVYPPRGEYQIVVEALQIGGQGDERARLLELHKKLAQEGLFDEIRKRPLPAFPYFIGMVTSATGAALQDIIRVLDDRGLGYHLILAHTRVQGEQAGAEIVAAIRALVSDGRSQVIICGRGGGSAEDLAVFNREEVVRAVASCPIPLVSAVGHEVDTTLTDLAADLRAATPSAAAQKVMPEKQHLEQRLGSVKDRLRQAMRKILKHHGEHLKFSRGRLLHPQRRIEQYRFRCDELQERMHLAMSLFERRRRPLVEDLTKRLQSWPKSRYFVFLRLRTRQGAKHLRLGIQKKIQEKSRTLEGLEARLHGVSPQAVLERGYAIVHNSQGVILTHVETLAPGETIHARLAHGQVEATVLTTRKRP